MIGSRGKAWIVGAWIAALYFYVHAGSMSLLFQAWLSFDLSFGLVIIGISAYMTYWAWRHLLPPGTHVHPSLLWGTIVTAAGNLLFLLGIGSSTLLLQQISLLVVLYGLVWLFLGNRLMGIFWVPLLYLIFALPLPGEILGRFSNHLQTAAAWVAAPVLSWSGMPVVRIGKVIELPHITLEVAKECSGVNHIIALMSLAVPLAFVSHASLLRKVFIAVGAFFLGIFLNGLRVAMIGWWSVSHRELHGPASTLLTSFIFFGGLAILSLLNMGLKGKKTDPPVLRAISVQSADDDSRKIVWAIALATIMMLGTGAMARYSVPRMVPLKSDSTALPTRIGEWMGTDSDVPLGFLKRLSPDVVVSRMYRNSSGERISLYLAYYSIQDQGREIVTYQLDRLQDNARPIAFALGKGRTLTLNATHLADQGNDRTAYFWYAIGQREYTSRYLAKLATGVGWLLRRRTNGTIVILVPESNSGNNAGQVEITAAQQGFIRQAVPLIRTFLRT